MYIHSQEQEHWLMFHCQTRDSNFAEACLKETFERPLIEKWITLGDHLLSELSCEKISSNVNEKVIKN